jgi:hypothetical protein
MFSGDTMVDLANGRKKKISEITRTDMILNKLNKPVRVRRINIFPNTSSVKIQLDNGTSEFYCSPSSIVYARYINGQGVHTVEFANIADVHNYNGKIKSSLKMFSPESDISILTYTEETEPQTLYSLEVMDPTRSYYVNGMIVSY